MSVRRAVAPLVVPAAFAAGTAVVSQLTDDKELVAFSAAFTARYARLVFNTLHFWRYKPSVAPNSPTVFAQDITIVIPTISVSEVENIDFEECVTTCLINLPAEVIVVTNTEEKVAEAKKVLEVIQEQIKNGTSAFQTNMKPVDISDVKVRVMCSGVASKRWQMAHVIPSITTKLTVFVDDHVFLPKNFLGAVVPVFEDPKVALCGTNKSVRRLPSTSSNLVGKYWDGVWNVLGACYLTRHNFEIRATNAADGGVFVVSGRAMAIRTSVIQDPEFVRRFTNEYFFFGLFGPIAADDDNFITRWILNKDLKIKIQYTEDAKIETTLGVFPKFPQQCLRWARTTFRSNVCALVTDRTVWCEWPATVWISYIAPLTNFALVWDIAIVYTFTKTEVYTESPNKATLLGLLIGWVYFAKLVKVVGYFKGQPLDFLLYFFPIPVYHIFAYFHSILKLWTALTFWDCAWSGRSAESTEQGVEKLKGDNAQDKPEKQD